MKEETLNQILKELFVIDPSLREKEEDLRRMIKKIIISQPDVSIDEQFVTKLRRDLLQTEIKQGFFQQILNMKNSSQLSESTYQKVNYSFLSCYFINNALIFSHLV